MKLKSFLFVSLTPLYFNFLSAQEAISSAGGQHSNSESHISWTLGETVIETLQNGEFTLTQGFQQADITVSTYTVNPDFDIEISTFPNPTREHLNILVQQVEHGLQFKLFNTEGQVIKSDVLHSEKTNINMLGLSPGIYFLNIINKEKTSIKTFKIIKQ